MSILMAIEEPKSGSLGGTDYFTDAGKERERGGELSLLRETAISAEVAELAIRADERMRRHMENTHAQMRQYARDLNEVIQRERSKTLSLEEMYQQLQGSAEQLQASMEREQQRARDLENAYVEMVRRLMNASAYKDRETGEHAQRLGHYARMLAMEAGRSESEANLLFTAAPMHDVGKIGIPDRILCKEGPLDPEEWAIMKTHPEIGARLLEGSKSPLIELARQVALGHHERWDGTGYPRGLRGDEIPMAARIVAIADCYDALRSRRPYKAGFSQERTCEIILRGDGRTAPEHFDPVVLEAFVRVKERMATIFETIRDPD
ncbi:MAG: HD domain-containing protein [Acidobacteria bacterium]|nr:HD domain-containing protein [Acidobacteriota bacterium]